MIFAAETEERSLHVFQDADTAASYCEGLAAAAAIWLFWDDEGKPLEPYFTIPNQRGLFTNKNGLYHLVPAQGQPGSLLGDILDQIRQVIGEFPFTNVRAVKEYLDRPAPALASPGQTT